MHNIDLWKNEFIEFMKSGHQQLLQMEDKVKVNTWLLRIYVESVVLYNCLKGKRNFLSGKKAMKKHVLQLPDQKRRVAASMQDLLDVLSIWRKQRRM